MTIKIAIEGNIGCGKTTQLSLLEDLGLKVFKEPIDKWPLDAFYEDPSRWGFLLQVVVLRTYYTDDTKDITIHERSPLSSKEIFWKNLVDSKVVTLLEDRIYKDEFQEKGWIPDVLILLDKDPSTCKEHINKRGQPGDKDMELDYLNSVDKYYNAMYEDFRGEKHRIDGSQSIEEVHKQILEIIKTHEQ